VGDECINARMGGIFEQLYNYDAILTLSLREK
jgi:hypothetical protein